MALSGHEVFLYQLVILKLRLVAIVRSPQYFIRLNRSRLSGVPSRNMRYFSVDLTRLLPSEFTLPLQAH
jgi:hypothetical protein